jgi:hypothetical protein
MKLKKIYHDFVSKLHDNFIHHVRIAHLLVLFSQLFVLLKNILEEFILALVVDDTDRTDLCAKLTTESSSEFGFIGSIHNWNTLLRTQFDQIKNLLIAPIYLDTFNVDTG